MNQKVPRRRARLEPWTRPIPFKQQATCSSFSSSKTLARYKLGQAARAARSLGASVGNSERVALVRA